MWQQECMKRRKIRERKYRDSNRPHLKFLVNYREAGKRKRSFFETKEAAKAFADEQNIKLTNEGREGAEFPTALRVMAQECKDALSKYGKTIKDVFAQYPPDSRKTAGLEGDHESEGVGKTRHTDRGGESQWPAPIDDAAYYGLAGDIVRTLEPQTEADPVALLIHVLVGVGNLGGRCPHFRVGGTTHYTNENAICVGKTSSARKGPRSPIRSISFATLIQHGPTTTFWRACPAVRA